MQVISFGHLTTKTRLETKLCFSLIVCRHFFCLLAFTNIIYRVFIPKYLRIVESKTENLEG